MEISLILYNLIRGISIPCKEIIRAFFQTEPSPPLYNLNSLSLPATLTQ